jgi:hypothetical protein
MKAVVVKTSKVVKGATNTVRTHLDAVERAREIYLAQIRRAEADYFERIKHATAIITGEPEQSATEPAPQPTEQSAA